MNKGDVHYLITLVGQSDDMPVATFDTRAGVDAFLRSNRPAAVDGPDRVEEGPLAEAFEVFPCTWGTWEPKGYRVYEFAGGRPTRCYDRRWLDDGWPGPACWAAMSEEQRNVFLDEEENAPWDRPVKPAAAAEPVAASEEWDVGGEG